MSKIKKLFPFLTDIRFWIVLLFILRLYGIMDAPLEVAHNWRQTTVTMVARNFYEIDANILYPRLDFAGNKTGIAGMEFPVLNYLIYLVSLLFGYADWYGRLINLTISSFGVWYFFKVIKEYFTKEIAFNAALILLFSIWILYARKIMPDTFATSLAIMSIYYGTMFFEKRKFTYLLLYVLLAILAILSKLPVGFVFVLFFLFIASKKYTYKTKITFVLASIAIFPVPFWWYFNWVPFLNETYGFDHFFMGKNIMIGFNEVTSDLGRFAKRFYDTALKFVGFGVFVFGLIQAVRLKNKKILLLFTLLFSAFLIIIFKSGLTFLMHSYYMVPFVPVMALVAAYGLAQINNKKIVVILLVAIAVEGILNNQDDLSIPEDNMALLQLEKDLDVYSFKGDLILINSYPNPTPMYFSHRKGWLSENKDVRNNKYVDGLRKQGLKYIVILKKSFGEDVNYEGDLVFENEHYKFYEVN